MVVERTIDKVILYISHAESNPVQDLSVVSINSTTFDISFTSPSAPNGIIDHYEIDIGNALNMPSNFTTKICSSNTTDQFVTTTTGLCELSRFFIPAPSVYGVDFC